MTIDGADLVPGDVVLLEAGDKVPADLRILSARGLAAQEAILTGESVPVEKGPDPVEAGAAPGSVICTDKTGTPTRNEMTVARAETPEGDLSAMGLAAAL